MKTLVIYNSVFGNTEKIAKVNTLGLSSGSESKCTHYKEIGPEDIEDAEIIVVGSPTIGFRATTELNGFLKSLQVNA